MREVLNITKALADENRVRILMSLRAGELCVCQVIEMLGLAPSTVSKHLAILQQACLVESRKEGRWVYYRLANREASACVQEATRWLQKHLAKDPQAVEDAKRLKAVCKRSKDDLCSHYRSQGRRVARSWRIK